MTLLSLAEPRFSAPSENPLRHASESINPNEWNDWIALGSALVAGLIWLWRHSLGGFFKWLWHGITAPQKIEAILQMLQKLQGEVAYAKAIGLAMPDLIDRPVWFSDATGQCVGCNDFYVRLLVRQKHEITGENWRSVIHPDDRNMVESQWNAAVRDKRDFALSYRFITSSGEAVPVFGLASCLRTNMGEVVGWIGKITLTEP
jgi:PAS domain-containing protein